MQLETLRYIISDDKIIGVGSLLSRSQQCHIEFNRTQFSYPLDHSSVTLNSPEHSSASALSLSKLSSSFTSTRCLHFRKELLQLLLCMPRQWYSAINSRKKIMINHNENELHHPGMKPGLLDSQYNIRIKNVTHILSRNRT